MRRLLALATLLLPLATARAAVPTDVQTRCGADWLPAFSFADGGSHIDDTGMAMLRDVIRLARGCRYDGLRIVLFGDDNTLAHARAQAIQISLMGLWPVDKTTVAMRPVHDAPHSEDPYNSFTADAIIEFTDPDPNWHGHERKATLLCSGDACKSLPIPAPRWIRTPWPSIGIHMPMVFFYSGSAALIPTALEVVDEAARRFQEANCRLLPVDGFADTAEAEPADLSLRRVLAVRAELVRVGVPPEAIVMHAFGNTQLLVPTPPGVAEPQNRRIETGCED